MLPYVNEEEIVDHPESYYQDLEQSKTVFLSLMILYSIVFKSHFFMNLNSTIS